MTEPRSRAPFPATAWTQILSARSDAPESKYALEQICRAYWPAVYTFLRALGSEREEARDLTQDFMVDFIQNETLHRLAPEHGRLRSYMMQVIRRDFLNHRRDAARKKRGGDAIHFSLDDLDAFDVPAAPDKADTWFDRRWAWTVLQRAIEVIRKQFSERGRSDLFEALKPGFASPDKMESYAVIGQRLGMTEGHVKLEMHRVRKRLADELRREVAATLNDPSETETELRYLLSVLGETS